METLVLNADPREETGRKVKQLRRDGYIPAVLYGHNVAAASLLIKRGEMEKVHRRAGGSSVIELKVGDKAHNVLIHAVQQHPVTGEFLHADLYQVRMDEKIKATVPLVFEGTPPAVRELDGILVTNLDQLEVECLPKDLPHELIVSVEDLVSFEDSILVSDIPIPSGVTLLTDPEMNVASVMPPRTQEEVDELEEQPEELDMDAVEAEGEGDEEPADGEEGVKEDSEDKSE